MMGYRTALCCCTLFMLLPACGPSEPAESRLRQAIESMAEALETGKPEPFMKRVAEDFTGDGGRWDYKRVRQYVLAQTLRNSDRPAIDLSDIRIEMFEGRARVTVDATFSDAGRWLPQQGADYRFETGWRLDDGEWRIIRADWERLER